MDKGSWEELRHEVRSRVANLSRELAEVENKARWKREEIASLVRLLDALSDSQARVLVTGE